MSVMDWVGTVGAIWLAVSILLAAVWALSGRRIFRKFPQPPMSAYDDMEFGLQRKYECPGCVELEVEEKLRGQK